MSLHKKEIVLNYLWNYSRFNYECLAQCEMLYKNEFGYSAIFVLFNCLENVSKSVANDYSSTLNIVFKNIYDNGILTKDEYEFLNEGDFCIRKIRNLYAHANIVAINFIETIDDKEVMYPLSENETSLFLYSKISLIIFNLIIKIVSVSFIDSVREMFQVSLDEAIKDCILKYQILSAKELLVLKGYPEDYISEDIPEHIRLRIVDNAPDANVYMCIFDGIPSSDSQAQNTDES